MFEGATDTRPTDIPTIAAMVAVTVEAVTMVLIATQVEAMVETGCPISELVYRSQPGVRCSQMPELSIVVDICH